VRGVLEQPVRDHAGTGLTALRAPTGRLPERVRGRDDLLACLRILAREPDGRVHVLAGLGGTGKSTVALRVAREMDRLGRAAWWVPAVDAGTVAARLLGLARELGAPAGEVTEALNGRRDPADLLWRFLQSRPGWLLVFDNADDLAALTVGGNDAAGGAGWLRPSAAGLIIVTSREGDRRAWGPNAELHPVSWLNAATGAQVLADLAPGAGPPEDAAALSERLGGLPLALRHAGSQLASEFTAEKTFRGYTQALDERFGRVMGHGAADDRAVVTRTWELSLDALAARGRPQARPLLRVLSCLAPAVLIPPSLLDLAVLGRMCADGEDEAAEGLAALSSVGLITASPGVAGPGRAVTVHPLVTETSRLQMSAEDLARTGGTAVALLAAAASRLCNDVPDDWPVWVQLAPHVQAVYGFLASRLADADLSALADAAESVAHAFLWAGFYSASQELAAAALQQTARLGADHPAVVSLRVRVARARMYLGEYAQAEQLYRNLIPDATRVLGPDHIMTLITRSGLAWVLSAQGQYEQAEQLYRNLLPDMMRVHGPDHLDTLGVRSGLAELLGNRGQYEQAERAFRDLLAEQTRVHGPDHPDTLTTRSEIASMLEGQGQREQAEQALRDLLADRLRIVGPDHPFTLGTRHQIALMLEDGGQYEQAERAFRDLLAEQTRVHGPDHPGTLNTRHQIARMLADRGQHEQAEEAFRDLLADRLRIQGPDHPDTLDVRLWIASLLADRGQHEQAKEAFRDLLADRLRIQGPDHPGTLNTRHQIARMIADRGQHEQAKEAFRDLLADRLRIQGPDHPDTRITQERLTGLENQA
jgi:tetratricopeptide (TPR) repeat protein